MKRVTLEDVARHAGVSRATVSLVIRGTGRVSESTKERVRASMSDLGYVYHRGAATLRTRKSLVVGLLITDLSNPFFSGMAVGLERVLENAGYFTMVANTFDDAGRQQALVRAMWEHPVEALAYVPVVGSRPYSGDASRNDPPGIALTRRPDSETPYIGPDDHAGGALAGEHLVVMHRRTRLVYLGGPESASPRGDRLAGVRAALERDPAARLVADLPGETNIEAGMALARELVRSGVEFDAVVCHSDVVAYALTHVLRRVGRPLDQVSIIGFDGLAESKVFEPAVTSVTVGPQRLGELAAGWMLQRLEGGDRLERPERPGGPPDEHEAVADEQLVTPGLEVRASCGCAPDADSLER